MTTINERLRAGDVTVAEVRDMLAGFPADAKVVIGRGMLYVKHDGDLQWLDRVQLHEHKLVMTYTTDRRKGKDQHVLHGVIRTTMDDYEVDHKLHERELDPNDPRITWESDEYLPHLVTKIALVD